jgi:hypothetical protein
MGLVNSLKFNSYSGAIITDEEYYILGRRRAQIADCLQPILTDEISNEFGMEVIYGGTGSIAFTNEVIVKCKEAIKKKYAVYKRTNDAKDGFNSVEDVARITFDIFQSVTRDKVNKKLYGLFGFTTEDLIRGFYMQDETKIEIKEDKVVSKALKIITNDGAPGCKDIFDNCGLVVGTDQQNGFCAFDYYGGSTQFYVSTGLYNAIGAGSTSTSLYLSNLINSLSLNQRRDGIDKLFGLVELLKVTNYSAERNNEVGGYYNIIYINGKAKHHKDRLVEISGDKAQIAKEIVSAYDKGFIKKETCYSLIDKIFFGRNAKIDELEKQMYAGCKNKDDLNLFLRGYKI